MQDRYGNALSITNPEARDAYQAGMDSWLSAQPGAIGHYQAAIALEPAFALAHAGLARALYLRSRIEEAKQAAARAERCAQTWPSTTRERSHVHIVQLLINGATVEAFRVISEHARTYPRDALAIQPCTGVFGLIGFSGRRGREAENLAFLRQLAPSFEGDWWFDSQHAFALCEVGQLAAAQELNTRALAANPCNANAIHHQAHLHYELGDAAAGLVALRQWRQHYSTEAVLYGHLAWHEALWALEQGRCEQVSQILKCELLPDVSAAPPLNIMTDIVSLLLRADLSAHNAFADQQEALWRMASDYAAEHFGTPGLSFADTHSAIAHVMAGTGQIDAYLPGSNIGGVAGDLVQQVATAFRHFAQGDWQAMLSALAPVMAQHERLGGSRAQRDLLELVYAYALAQLGQRRQVELWYQSRRPALLANV